MKFIEQSDDRPILLHLPTPVKDRLKGVALANCRVVGMTIIASKLRASFPDPGDIERLRAMVTSG